MELNTSVWGTPNTSSYSEFGGIATYNGNIASWRTLQQNGKTPINNKIDDSIFWAVTKISNRTSTQRHFLVQRDYDDGYYGVIESSVTPSQPTHFIFNYTNYSGGASEGFVNPTNGQYAISHWDNTTIGENYGGLEYIYPCSKPNRGGTCFLALVRYFRGVTKHTDKSNVYYTADGFGLKSVFEFINDSNLYNNPDIYVTAIRFEPYMGSPSGSRSMKRMLLMSDETIRTDLPSGQLTDYSWIRSYGTPERDDRYLGYNTIANDVLQFQYGCAHASCYQSSNYGQCMLLSVPHYVQGSDVGFFYIDDSYYEPYFATIIPHDMIETVMHYFAETGCFYSPLEATAKNSDLEACNDPDLYWGEVVSGLATGKVCKGGRDSIDTTNPDLPRSHDPENDPDYDGDDNTDMNVYSDETPLTPPSLSPVGVFNRCYAITANQLRILADELWNADEDKFDEIVTGLKLMGENPMNGLIDCRLYPFDVTRLFTASSGVHMVVGRTELECYARPLTNVTTAIINLGSCSFFKKFKNFLDYSPYTEGRLYLPYIGIVPIDTAEFMGHEISAKMVVDIITGACCAFVYKDGIICIKASGVIGVGIPMTGTDSATFAQTVTSNLISGTIDAVKGAAGLATIGATSVSAGEAHAVTTTVSPKGSAWTKTMDRTHTGSSGPSALTGGTDSASQMINGAWKLYQASATPVQYASAGSASPSCENWLPQYAYFIIDVPIPNVPDNYAHTVGYACFKSDTLDNFSGYTVCTNVDTSGFNQATEGERAELKMLLESGVYL